MANEIARFRAVAAMRQAEREVTSKKAAKKVLQFKKPQRASPEVVCEQCGESVPVQLTKNGICTECREIAEAEQVAAEATPDLKEILRRVVELKKRRWILEFQLGQVMEETAQVEEQLQDAYISIGIKSTKYGTATIYLKADYWVKPKEEGKKLTDIREEVVSACLEAGLDYMVKENVNAKTLSAYINERKREKLEIPDQLADLLEINPDYKVSITGLGKSSTIVQYQMERETQNGNTTITTNEEEDSTDTSGGESSSSTQTSTSTGAGVGRRRSGGRGN